MDNKKFLAQFEPLMLSRLELLQMTVNFYDSHKQVLAQKMVALDDAKADPDNDERTLRMYQADVDGWLNTVIEDRRRYELASAEFITNHGKQILEVLRGHNRTLAALTDYVESQERGDWPGEKGTYPDAEWSREILNSALEKWA